MPGGLRRRHGRSRRAGLPVLLATLVSCALPLPLAAKVTGQEAVRLGAELTPIGAERAGNPAGTIPAWAGGLTAPPACFEGPGGRYCDPYPDDTPLSVITADNVAHYQEQLSAGQLALIRQYPDTYRMPVYATRRSFANPDFVYAAARANATRAELRGNGEVLAGAVTGIPFPLPGNGHEVIWNHRTRYRGISVLRWNNQFAVTAAGDFNLTRIREDVLFNYSRPDIAPESLDNVLMYFLQVTMQPARLAGSILLIHETMDTVAEARRVWQFNPGQRRLRRAPSAGYDAPAIGADGLRTSDQTDTFSGPMDRYDWKLLGKQELYVPVNSYRLHSERHRYADIVGRKHLNADLLRYELRRVWVVEARLRAGSSHQYRRRRFHIDEDGWQIRVVDLYDGRDQLWRLQETHTVLAYDKAYELPVCETVYDLRDGRYLVQALNNEDPETVTKVFERDHFEPGSVSRLATR